jgi:hypothetical protein
LHEFVAKLLRRRASWGKKRYGQGTDVCVMRVPYPGAFLQEVSG